MSSDEIDSDHDYNSLVLDDVRECFGDFCDVRPVLLRVEIRQDGDNSVVVTWNNAEENAPHPSYSYAVWLSCDGKSFGDGKGALRSPIRFEGLERFKKYSAKVMVVLDEDDCDEDFVQSRFIVLGADQFIAIVEELKKYPDALKKMISQEKEEETLTKMMRILEIIFDLEKKLVGITEDAPLPSEENINEYKHQVQKWFNEKSPLPPDIQGLHILPDRKGITVNWDAIAWPSDLQYGIQVYCTQAEYGEVKLVSESSFLIEAPDPTKKFHVEVWSVGGDKTGKKSKSEEIMICKDLGKVLVDCTKPIREGYSVYEGFLTGAFGKLDKVAVKIVKAADAEQLRRELKITEELRAHRNTVLHLVSGDIEDAVEIQAYIVLELCKKDTLYEMVKDSVLKQTNGKIALTHIISGLSHLHEKNIFHRDFKPQNILCSLDGKDLKISDFGLSKQAKPEMSKVSKSMHEIGTDGWGSPEHYKKDAEMSDKSDIYSAGLVFFFVLSDGKHAMGENEYQWKANIIEGCDVDYSLLACEDSELAQDLIQKMLQRKPEDRLDAYKVSRHPFFWRESRLLEFLHERAKFFAEFTYAKPPQEPTEDIKKRMKQLKDDVHLIQTKSGDANWYRRMIEFVGVEEKYSIVLAKAANRRWKYNHSCVFHLLRFIRNTHEHFGEDLKSVFSIKAQIWNFFSGIFPLLFCAVYNAGDDDQKFYAGSSVENGTGYQPLISDRKRNEEDLKDSCPPQKISKN